MKLIADKPGRERGKSFVLGLDQGGERNATFRFENKSLLVQKGEADNLPATCKSGRAELVCALRNNLGGL